MHITAMLVLLHGPKEQRFSFACLFPSFPDVLLLLLVLDQMLAFVFSYQYAPVEQFSKAIRSSRAVDSWPPEHPHHIANPALRLRSEEHTSVQSLRHLVCR